MWHGAFCRTVAIVSLLWLTFESFLKFWHIWKRGVSLNAVLQSHSLTIQSGCLVSKSPGCACPCLLSSGITGTCHHVFLGGAGVKILIFMLGHQAVYWLNNLPRPSIRFFNQVLHFLFPSCKSSLYILKIVLYQTGLLQIDFSNLCLVFSFSC